MPSRQRFSKFFKNSTPSRRKSGSSPFLSGSAKRLGVFETLEARRMLAVLSNAPGDGTVSIGIDGFGSYGSNIGSFGSNANYDPVGPIGIAGTTFLSAVSLATPSGTQWLSTGFGTGNSDPPTESSNALATSSFSAAGLDFNLEQRLSELFVGVGEGQGERSGSLLTQTYLVTNSTANEMSFSLARYVDGDLSFDGSISDGGGRLPLGGGEILFETDSATGSADEATFVGITAQGGILPTTNRYEISGFSTLRSRVEIDSLRDIVSGDGTDEDEFIDAGSGFDLAIALRNEFVLGPGESTTYITQTIFGTGNPDALTQIDSLSLEPLAVSEPVTSRRSLTATALDESGEPVIGAAIQFNVMGSNPTSGEAFTDFEGRATFSYQGNIVGQDTITASVGLVASNPSVVEWTPIPNLVVSNPTSPTISTAGNQVEIGWTVTNADSATAVAPWSDAIYLSSDSAVDESDILLEGGIGRTADLPATSEYSRTRVVTIPSSVAVGDYFVLVATDIDDAVFERSEADNVASIPIEIALPDLQIDAAPTVTASGTPTFGDSIDVAWTVTNAGSVAAERTAVDRIWLSADDTLGSDTLLASVQISANLPVDPDGSYTEQVSVDLPLSQNLPPGEYYIIVQADGTNTERETDNSNNWQASSQIIIDGPSLPDLIVSGITAPAAAVSNGAIPISWQITNQGDAPFSGVFRDRVHLSSDETIGDDTNQGTFEFVGAIDAGQTITRTQSIALPTVLEGDFYAVVTTDVNDEVFEQFGAESNNAALDDQPIDVTLAPFPNLQIAEVIAPPIGASSQDVVVEWIVTNVGNGDTNSPRWIDSVYLSTDQAFDGTDVLLGRVANPSFLLVGDSYRSTLTTALPRGIDGDFHFIVRTDSSDQVFELDGEDDNQSLGGPTDVELTPPPDLQVTVVQGPSTAFSGQPVNVNWSVINNGTGPTVAGSWLDRVFVSTDNVLDANDTLIATVGRNGALDVGEEYFSSATGTLPIGISGDFFFIVQTDASNGVFEHVFEANNTGFDETPTDVRLTPPPDLEVEMVDAPMTATASRPLAVDYRVANFGATVTPNSSWTDQLYLSADQQFDQDDTLLQSRTHFGSLEAGEGYDATFNVILPDELTGEFFVFVVTDGSNVVFEDALGEDNNVGLDAETLSISSEPADLAVVEFSGPSSAEAGQSLLVDWVVENRGVGDTAVINWQDRVVLSDDQTLSADDLSLATVGHNGLLRPTEQYTVNGQLVTIPFTVAPGDYFLLLTTDSRQQVFEAGVEGNNLTSSPISISRETSDLLVSSVAASTNASSGGQLNVSWIVENNSPATTNANFWFDEVYLSSDGSIDETDVLLGTVQRSNPLAPSDQYLASRDFALPRDLSGQFFVIVRTDATNLVVEGLFENNNDQASAGNGNEGGVDVELTSPPDLVVSAVEAPADAFSGQPIELSWTVDNVGPGTAEGTWFDSVYLSLDQVFDRSTDLYLGFADRTDNLSSGGSYTQTSSFDIPAGISGPYWVFVVTDGNNRIAERNGENNNSNFDPLPVQIALTPPADFVIGTITVPVNGISGQNATISYTVENQETNPVVGTWTDSIYLSVDEQWDIDDPLFGRVRNTNFNVVGGGSYSQNLTAALPGVVPGDYHVIIRSDILNQIRESDDANNIGVSLDRATVDFEQLQLGVPSTGNLAQGQSIYYRVDVPAGETLSFLLNGAATNGTNEVYVAFDRVPTRSDFDFSSTEPFEVDQRALVPSTEAGTYFALVFANDAAGETQQYDVTAELLEFDVFDTNYGRGGNVGNLTIEIKGAKFDRTVTASLADSEGMNLPAQSYYYDSSIRLFATFDLRELEAGTYSVMISSEDGATIAVEDSLQIVDTADTPVIPNITAPSTVRRNRGYAFSVGIANDGLNDVVAPVLRVSNSVPLGLSPGDTSLGSSYEFIAFGDDGPPGIIRPGGSQVYNFFSFSDNSPGAHEVSIDRVYKELEEQFSWDLLKPQLRRFGLSVETFDEVFDQLVSRIGNSSGDYLAALSTAANHLPSDEALAASQLDLVEWHLRRVIAESTTSLAGSVRAIEPFGEIGLIINAENIDTGEAYSTTVENDGSFLFHDVSPGSSYGVSVQGFLVDTPMPVEVIANQSVSGVEAVLSLGVTTRFDLTTLGQSVDSSNALLILVNEGGEAATGIPEDEASLTVTNIRPGSYTLLAEVPGFGRLTREISIDSDTSVVELAFSPESTISATVRVDGQVSSEDVFGIATPHEGGGVFGDIFFSQDDQGNLLFEGLPAGSFDITIVKGENTQTIEDFQLTAGGDNSLGVIDFTTLTLPPNVAASHSSNLVLEAQLAAAEAYLQTVFIPAITARFGLQVGSLWQAFLISTPATPITRAFSDGDAVVEGNFFENGFRDDPQVNAFLDSVLRQAAVMIQDEFSSGSLDCDDDVAHGGQTFDIRSLLSGANRRTNINFSDAFSIPGNIAGGDGQFLSRLDDRFVTGNVTATLRGETTVVVESQLTFHVIDAVDFQPGDLGASIERVFTVPLDFLENNGHAWGIAYTATFDDEPGRTVNATIPRQDCCEGPDCDDDDDDEEEIERPASVDPNDILGPDGFGPERWAVANEPLGYTIRFENDPIFATAPAQVVRITQQLDSDLDFRTFRVGNFAIGSNFFEVPDNQAFFTERLDLTEDFGVLVDVFAGIDVQTGEAFWELTSIDPETGEQPEDALTGFLPPNLVSPEGEGFVTYSVRPMPSTTTGDVIDAEARIVFDVNEPIDTPPIFNTLDVDLPTSSVEALPAGFDTTTFEVAWAGVDSPGGSGIANYDIFVSENDDAFRPFLTGTTLTSAPFVGETGRRYEFYSVARDNAGNIEAAPATADASTTIQGGLDTTPPISRVSIDEANSNEIIWSLFANDPDLLSGQQLSGVSSTEVLVSRNEEPFEVWQTLLSNDLPIPIPVAATGSISIRSIATDLAGNVEIKNTAFDAITYVSLRTSEDPAVDTSVADFGDDGMIDVADLDALDEAIRESTLDPRFDLNDDGQVTSDDRVLLVESVFGTRGGDADLDGTVTFEDFLILSSNFGQDAATWSQGDFDGDGEVAFADFLVLSANFGDANLAGDANSDGTVGDIDFALLTVNFGQSGTAWINGDFDRDGIASFADFLTLSANFPDRENSSEQSEE